MVRCNEYEQFNWRCTACAHSKGHEPVSIRQATSESLPCDEFSTFCFERNMMVKCAEYVEKKATVSNTYYDDLMAGVHS